MIHKNNYRLRLYLSIALICCAILLSFVFPLSSSNAMSVFRSVSHINAVTASSPIMQVQVRETVESRQKRMVESLDYLRIGQERSAERQRLNRRLIITSFLVLLIFSWVILRRLKRIERLLAADGKVISVTPVQSAQPAAATKTDAIAEPVPEDPPEEEPTADEAVVPDGEDHEAIEEKSSILTVRSMIVTQVVIVTIAAIAVILALLFL